MKNHSIILFIAVALLAASASFSSCKKENSAVQAEDKTFSVSLDISLDDGQTKALSFGGDGKSVSSYFTVGDKVSVFNMSKKLFDYRYLTVTKIKGKIATISGQLSATEGDYSKGDKLRLCYNLSKLPLQSDSPETRNIYSYFTYEAQDGTKEKAGKSDFAIGTGSVTAIDPAKGTITIEGEEANSPVRFSNIGSVFRFSFVFKRYGKDIKLTSLKSLTISSENRGIYQNFSPAKDVYTQDLLTFSNLTIDSNGELYLCLGINDPVSPNKMIITATDYEGNIYQAEKTAPSGNFQKGKYYYFKKALTMEMKDKKVKPTITTDDNDPPILEQDRRFIFMYNSQSPITLSGKSNGYRYIIRCDPCKLTLDNFEGTFYTDHANQIIHCDGSVNILLKGTNIFAGDINYCIEGGLRFGLADGESSATLKITTVKEEYWGFISGTEWTWNTAHDPTILAMPGFTVTGGPAGSKGGGSASNGDNTFTFLYTVKRK